MTRDVEHIILNKEYTALTPVELEVIQEWIENEEDFNLHKAILAAAPKVDEGVVPPAALKQDLMAAFQQQHASGVSGNDEVVEKDKKKVIALYVKMAWSVAAVLMLGLLVYPMFQDDSVVSETTSTPLAQEGDIENNQPKETEKIAQLDEAPINAEQLSNTKKLEQQKVSSKLATKSNDQLSEQSLDADQMESQPTAFSGNLDVKEESISSMEDFSATAYSAMPETSTFNMTDANVLVHSDILDKKDVLKANRQIVEDKPQILDLLYTSF